MSKGIILYQSKYGATKKYAQWLQESTGFDLVETKKADINVVKGYDTIILGGGVYASGIAGLSFLKKNYAVLKDKKVVVFSVGASPYDEAAFKQAYDHNFQGEIAGLPCFYMRGAWDTDSLSFTDRTLCKMLYKAVSKKDPTTYEPWEKAIMEAYEEKCDWTDKAAIIPILDYINN